MNLEKCKSEFVEKFNLKDFRMFFSPGRINLIGEHTDYNGGNVFPAAITFGTYGFAGKNQLNKFRLYSMNFPEKGVIEFGIDELEYNKKHDWANYCKGMIRYLKEEGYEINSGVDMLFYGNIPNGAGLSSSASIELVTGVILEGLFNIDIDRIALVKIGKRIENEFIGVNSGIMDQFAIGMGKKDCGILLDCETLTYSYAPLRLEKHNIVIMNTNKRRELADSKYNERRAECEESLRRLQKVVEVISLGQLTEEEFEEYKYIIGDEILTKRAKHAVYENRRTIKALEELNKGNLETFGELMNQSHVSLRDDYEVTGIELDTLVETAWKQKGVVGARMTGAGFGGCSIAIVEKDDTEEFIKNVGEKYKEVIGYDADFYIASIGGGAGELKGGDI